MNNKMNKVEPTDGDEKEDKINNNKKATKKDNYNESPKYMRTENEDDDDYDENSCWWIYVVSFFIRQYGVILASGLLAKGENSKAKTAVLISFIPVIIAGIIILIVAAS